MAEVEFSEWTPDGHLRHPSFQGLREDKKAKSIVKEIAEPTKQATSEAESEVAKSNATIERKSSKTSPAISSSKSEKDNVAGIGISHGSRLIFPESDVTKLQLAEYYNAVADHILPYVEHRPLSVIRCPEGTGKECFFQRHVGFGKNADIHEVSVGVKGEDQRCMSIDDERGLISLVQWGVIEFHPWQCSDKKLNKPDQIIFDLDPDPAITWKELIAGAKIVRSKLQEIGFDPYLKTTGGKGLHLVVPLVPEHDFPTIKAFTRAVAETITKESPDKFIATMSKAARKGKIFIDYLRNDTTSTAIAPFSIRARIGAPVSVTLDWSELKPSLVPANFTIKTVPTRLKKLKADPWKNFSRYRQKISSKLIA